MRQNHPIIMILVSALTLIACDRGAVAYNPPVDEAGPLSVTINGPEDVVESGKKLPVTVELENSGNRRVSGSLRLKVIDDWRVDPAGVVTFDVPEKERTVLRFTATAGERTYSAHYPIHAYVNAEVAGEKLTAHPVLILETKLASDVHRRPRVPFEPIAVMANSELALWRVKAHRSVVAPHGEEAKTMPVGWQGSESATGGSTTFGSETLDGVLRPAISIHPPWQEGRVGTQWIEFPLDLPDVTPLCLRFAVGMPPTGQSDGVTFRVRAAAIEAPAGRLGEVVFEQHTAANSWTEAEADLSDFAGQTIRLQLESHPGPENNTGWDRSLWAEPLLVAGTIPEPMPFPPGTNHNARVLGRITTEDTEYRVRFWRGTRGLLNGVVEFSNGKHQLLFKGFQIKVRGGRIDDRRAPVLLEEVRDEPCDRGVGFRHRFRDRWGTFDVVGRLHVDAGGLKARFTLENAPDPRPWQAWYLEEVSIGPWNRGVAQVYAGAGNVIRAPKSFELPFDGHRLSTSFVGVDFVEGGSVLQASDVPPLKLKVSPEENHCALHTAHNCTLTLVPASNVWQAVKHWRATNELEPAGGVEKVAGRFVFDLWGGRYADSMRKLQQAFRYGLTDAMVVWHNWQRWGYDYRLPNIHPPNPRWGTLKEMQSLVNACREAGVIFAPHDNYIDFYPDADGFSYEETIAFNHQGEPVKAWLNEGRDARSYRYRADAVDPFLKSNVAWIHEHLDPTGYFIDVWSSIRPYSYWTSMGEFVPATYTRDKWAELFNWIRNTLGDHAPQISESGHDALIGSLDGAQTNHLRVGEPEPGERGWCVWNWECADAERTPWFDAAHHDRFVLHGAGYGSRYAAGLDDRLHGMYSDDYICTEVLTGHPAMVSRPFGRDVVRKYWLTAELMRALALRRIETVSYVDDDLQRQYVQWSGGGQVWVNRGETDWETGTHTLPPYGFFARVPRTSGGYVEAGIVRRQGIMVEFSRSDSHVYVNGRQLVDSASPVRMHVKSIRCKPNRRFELDVEWEMGTSLSERWRPFLHFCDESGDIVFQATHESGDFPHGATGQFQARAHGRLPAEVTAGQECLLVYGLYDPKTGERLRLPGPGLGDRRIRAGQVTFQGTGEDISALKWYPHVSDPDPLLARRNVEGTPVQFDSLETAGGCRLHREARGLVVTPLPGPGAPAFHVNIDWKDLPWKLPFPSQVSAVGEDGAVLSPTPISATDRVVHLECRPGEFAYQLGGDTQ